MKVEEVFLIIDGEGMKKEKGKNRYPFSFLYILVLQRRSLG